MIELRVTGEQSEITFTIDRLEQQFEIIEISKFYPNRGESKLGRVYVKIKL